MKDEGVADSLIGSRSSFTIAYDKAKDWLKLQGSPVSDYLLEKEPYLWYLFSFREISTLASFAILAGLWMPKVWLKNHVVSYWTWNTRTFFSKVCALFLPSFSYCLLVCQSSDLSGCPFLLLPYPTTRPFFVYSADRERQQADIRRAEAREIDQLTGIYRHAYLLVDPCTNFRGNSPVVGKKADKTDITGKMAKHFEQRIIGVEVVCGPIDGIFFYTTDNMQRGGANVIVSWI